MSVLISTMISTSTTVAVVTVCIHQARACGSESAIMVVGKHLKIKATTQKLSICMQAKPCSWKRRSFLAIRTCYQLTSLSLHGLQKRRFGWPLRAMTMIQPSLTSNWTRLSSNTTGNNNLLTLAMTKRNPKTLMRRKPKILILWHVIMIYQLCLIILRLLVLN